MKNIFKGKVGTALILTVTVILAGIAIFTAVRLFQLGNQPVAPNVPSSIPQAAENTCSLTFTISKITPTPTPTVAPGCSGVCTADTDCPSGLTCYQPPKPPCPPGQMCSDIMPLKVCRNSSCQDSASCVCPTPTPTPTVTPTETPGPTGTPNSCNGTCGSNSNCNNGLTCSNGFCRNPSCTNESSCNCPGTSTSTPAPTTPALPSSGTDWPTVVGGGVGVLVIIGSLLLAL